MEAIAVLFKSGPDDRSLVKETQLVGCGKGNEIERHRETAMRIRVNCDQMHEMN